MFQAQPTLNLCINRFGRCRLCKHWRGFRFGTDTAAAARLWWLESTLGVELAIWQTWHFASVAEMKLIVLRIANRPPTIVFHEVLKVLAFR